MTLFRHFGTGKAECSEFGLTQSRASTKHGAILAAKIVLFLWRVSIIC